MRTDMRFILALACGLLAATAAVGGETPLLTLMHNPFTRPQILKPKPPPPPAPRVELPPEQIELELSATLVSDSAPMAVVDGELLAIGDTIGGFRLIAVMEGRAVFIRAGKKYAFEIESGDPE